jgi:hypothetical protein
LRRCRVWRAAAWPWQSWGGGAGARGHGEPYLNLHKPTRHQFLRRTLGINSVPCAFVSSVPYLLSAPFPRCVP